MTEGLGSLGVNGGQWGHEDRGRESDRIGKQRGRTTRRITGYANKAEIQEGAGHGVQGTRCRARGVLHMVQGPEQDREQDQEWGQRA